MRLSVVLFRFFISSKDSHRKSRDRLISASSDSSVALAVRFPAFGMVGVIVFARLCALPVANSYQLMIKNNVIQNKSILCRPNGASQGGCPQWTQLVSPKRA